MKLRPLQDRVIVKQSDAEEKTKSGIVLPDSAKEKPTKGKVIAVGPGKLDDKGKPHPPKIDGFMPEQRFFLAWAQIWRNKATDQSLRNQVVTDPHAPAVWRVRGPLSNLPEFAAAFRCKAGDAMVRADSLRAEIW
jgi:predicted metalloendopeptidase